MKDLDIDQWTDKQLLESIQRGSVAERVLYQRHTAYAINLAFRFIQNRAQAEEVAQDVWLALHRHLKKHCVPTEFKPYLAAMVINRCRKIAKKKHESISLDAALLAHLEESEPHSVTVKESLPGRIEQDDLANAVSEGLRSLSDVEYMAIKLRYFDEFSYAEIAEMLGKTEGHARLITHRALSELRKEFDGARK